MAETIYRMPAEWEPQDAIWLSWPHNEETWPENLAEAQSEFTALARLIATTQPVCVLAGTTPSHTNLAGSTPLHQAQQRFSGVEDVVIVEIATNDAWARDYAPTFVKKISDTEIENSNLVVIDWHYNAWGGKYPPFDDDQKVATLVAKHLGAESVTCDFCFEGGAVEVNSTGVLLSTKSCALDPNRNPNHTLAQVDSLLSMYLGTTKHIWLAGDAIDGDDTDGHIDQLARFTSDNTIVYAWTNDESDSQHRALTQNLNDLQTELKRLHLDHYRLIPLPIPSAIEYCGRRIPASYCNFLITNDKVIVPQFGQPEDTKAIEILDSLFQNRKVIGLDSLNLSVGLGSFHCLSQQQPA